MGQMFDEWLHAKLNERGWKQADLARAANLDSAVISNLINKKRGPGKVTCQAIAHALRIPVEVVYREAELLPSELLADERSRVLYYQIMNLPDEPKEQAMEYIAFLYARTAK